MWKKLLLVTSAAIAASALLLPSPTAYPDDRDLLRFNTAKPYLFILMDTSGSMNLSFGADNVPTVGHGDDPASKIYAAKEALFTVFESVDDVHFGFAAYNQDDLRVRNKHWLYYVDVLPNNWPSALGWPTPDPDGLTTDLLTVDTDDDGTPDSPDGIPDNDVEGDAIVFGPVFQSLPNPLVAGTCGDPLDLTDTRDRARLNAFAKLGGTGALTSFAWVSPRRNQTWLLSFERPSNRPDTTLNGFLGDDNLHVKIGAEEIDSCFNLDPSNPPNLARFNFNLRLDPNMDDFVMVDRGVPGSSSGNNAEEWTANLWPWSDAVQDASCGSSSPFTGKGWEGNYDAGITLADIDWDEEGDDYDRFCLSPFGAGPESLCLLETHLKPMQDTSLSGFGRAMDTGDMLPFDWTNDNRMAFLQRLAPNWPEDSVPDFGVTAHLQPSLASFTAPVGEQVFVPVSPGREPIVAVGDTPLGKAINDVRCWYMGDRGTGNGGKCRSSAFFDAGWSEVACSFDSEYGCRKPFLIMITDGDDTCAGENPGADVSDMKSFTGVQAWALNLGDPRNCQSGTLSSIVTRAGGNCINVANKQELKDTLQDILGEIREQSRAFASAAVPSVQATADQALYISNFTPLNGKSVWDGHLNAFLKPLPVTPEGTPDTGTPCNATTTSECFLWDAGARMKEQVNAAAPVGPSLKTQRRVFFGQEEAGNSLPLPLRNFAPSSLDCSGCVNATDDTQKQKDAVCRERCFDLLDALNISSGNGQAGLNSAETIATNVINRTLALKSHTLTNPDGSDGDTIQFVLGDIFHSNPIVVGTPNNVQYFAKNVGSDPDNPDCEADDTGNPGYRCFLRRQRFRRKVIVVGANDGQFHAFNAGFFQPGSPNVADGRYDNGTGHELFSFLPRATMPVVKEVAQNQAVHKFSVDGTAAVADVFIDPVHAGTPNPDQRRWRTLAISGLREGGSAYFAVDITQPDKLRETGSEFVPDTNGGSDALPSCAPPNYDATLCGPLPYPSALWQISDTTQDSLVKAMIPDPPVLLDEDANGQPDLGETWSTPVIGRIRLCAPGGSECNPNDPDDDGDLEDVYVAIFGGGMDPDQKSAPLKGDWLYMVDIERGKVVYKRRLVHPDDFDLAVSAARTGGSAPMEPAAVDTDQDSYIDRIYVGTTGGYLYRVDLTPGSSGDLPELADVSVQGLNGVTYTAERVPAEDSGDPLWQPRVIFNANFSDVNGTLTPTTVPRPLYHRPSVVFVAKFGLFGLAFGTGDREDLWNENAQTGRFYIFLDDTDQLANSQEVDLEDLRPRNEGDFQRIGVADGNLTEDLFVTRSLGQKGWFLVLDPNERVITNSFSLAGVTFFSSFQPEVAITQGCDPSIDPNCEEISGTCGDKSFESDTTGRCAKGGFSRLFVVGTTNANGFLTDPDTNSTSRFEAISTFVTNPFTEPGSNPNDATGDGDPNTNSDRLSDAEINVMQSLMSLFPENCNFANYRIDIKTIAADTRIERIAPVPICIVEKNWKEF